MHQKIIQNIKLAKQTTDKTITKNLPVNDWSNIKYTTFTYYGNITRKVSKLIKDTNFKTFHNS